MKTRPQMVNEDYNPSQNEERILDLLKEGRDRGDPWGVANPYWIRDRTGLNPQQVNYALNQLRAAGWVEKVTDGLYRLAEDPRDDRSECPKCHRPVWR